MNLSEYLENNPRAELASAIGVSLGMISQWVNKTRPVSTERCVSIEKATNGQVTRKDLRPDDWAVIWPELLVESKKSKSSKQPRKEKP